MIKIAVTGGLASGKSLVCSYLHELGAFVVSADTISHELLTSNQEKVVELLGETVAQDGKLDRSAIAEIVFNDPSALLKLEHLIHPQVTKKIKDLYQEIERTRAHEAFVVEFPLLFEIDFHKWFDYSIAVISAQTTCQNRLEEKGLSLEQYEKRQSRLLKAEQLAKLANFTIVNEGTKEELKQKTQHTFKKVYETDGSGRASNKS